MLTKPAGLRQILTAVTSQSSFIVARIVAHKSVVPRPFSVVFQASEAFAEVEVSASQRLREWSASIGELLGGDYYSPSRRRRRGGGDFRGRRRISLRRRDVFENAHEAAEERAL